MKILLVFAVVVATSYAVTYTQETMSKEYADKLKEDLRKCKRQFPSISDADFQKLSNNRKMPNTTDEECFAKKRKYCKRPGQMDLAKLKAGNAKKYKVPTNLGGANSIDETCVKQGQKETNDCKTASQFFVCRALQAQAKNFTFAKPPKDK